jgi:hypothetical protein
MNMRLNFRAIFRLLFITTVSIVVLAGTALGTEEKAALQMNLPPPDVPRPQLFCGYCHVLTYPEVVQKGYELWKKGKHGKFGCVECHYPPKGAEVKLTATPSATEVKPAHIPKNPPERFSYLPLGGSTIQTRPKISDASCMTAACHGKPDDKFKTKKIQFTEKVLFVHEPHFDKKKQIEGQQVTCVSCHQHETDQKKFEVTQDSCHLCHFKNVKFNQDRGRCELCHKLPEKPIQTSGEKPITHQVLKEANTVMGAGDIKNENCLACHDQAKALKEVANKKLMHEKHVTVKNARCFDCHQVIMHKKSDINPPTVAEADNKKSQVQKPMSERFVTDSCLACHPKPHELQRRLAEGLKRKDVPGTPGFHYKARATCMACHLEQQFTEKGTPVLMASAKTCTGCHPGRKNMLKDWQTELKEEVKYTKEVEKEALDALSKAKLSKPMLAEANKMLNEGQQNLKMVQFGNGVHNKKYSLFLLDAAITRFEDVIAFIEDNQNQ